MTIATPLPEEKKLRITFRLEPGCLGPNGADLIDEFCEFAEEGLHPIGSKFVVWNIVPRNDKSLPEFQFSVVGKTLSRGQAERYLGMLDNQPLDDYEIHLEDRIADLIDEFT